MADFATVAELEEFMGAPGLGARGTSMLGFASSMIRAHTRQDLEATTGRQEEYAGDPYTYEIQLTQRPVVVTAVTVDAVAFTEFDWTRWGRVTRSDGSAWSEGPIVITYDSGYAPGSDEMAQVKAITLKAAARALGGPVGLGDVFGSEVPELRGAAPVLLLTTEERNLLDGLIKAAVG